MHRLIIDTDTAADDSFALLVGLLHPEARLEAVTVVAGNVAFDQQVQNALITIERAGRSGEVPVHLGARVPLLRPWQGANAHGDGKGDADFAAPRQRPSDEPAADAIVRIVDSAPGEIEIVAIGPLTNIATALLRDRELPGKVRRLWVMGGCDNAVGNVTAAAEYNFFVDPEAAALVMRAGFAVTLVTWTLTLRRALWDRRQLAEIAAIDTPLARYFTVLDAPNLVWNEGVGLAGSTHPDSLTAMLVVEPSLATATSEAHVDVETAGDLTRGYSLVDRRPGRGEVNAVVVDDVDAYGFVHAFRRLLGEQTG